MQMQTIDVAIAGAGPGGLSAALCLARVGRQVLVLDGGSWRSASSNVIHTFFSRDGSTPAEIRTSALAQLRQYPCAKVQAASADSAEGKPGNFKITLGNGQQVQARRLVLATGVEDILPDIAGLPERWGQSVVHCPYCHGWERMGLPLAVLALDDWAVHQAVQVRNLSDDVVLCTNGTYTLTDDQRAQLKVRGVAVREEPLARLEGPGTSLERLVFTDADPLERQGLFCHAPTRQLSDLAAQLECRMLPGGSVEVNEMGQTSQPGVYAIGDMAQTATNPFPAQQVVVAAAAGVMAAIVIDQELLYSD
jgi:thioredoxin reductase